MSAVAVPLKFARLASLFLTFSFGIVGLALGINALVKSNDLKDFVKQNAPLGAQVDIDTSDVFSVGTVVVVVSGLLALTSIIFLPLLAISSPIATRSLPIQTSVFGFLTLWLFASLVPYTTFIANRSAKITATLGGVPIPDSIIQSTQQALGVSPVYKDASYLRTAVILAWIAFFFGITTTALSFSAHRRARTTGTDFRLRDNARADDAKSIPEKQADEKKEVAEVAQGDV
ncbi:unnamed protein product [Somion occarium]|uniref:Uncharacterized protein n=1 Tax=Somion occarium TaxID=3059160 RepID=A0ABP1DT52_9APHY